MDQCLSLRVVAHIPAKPTNGKFRSQWQMQKPDRGGQPLRVCPPSQIEMGTKHTVMVIQPALIYKLIYTIYLDWN